MHSLPSIATIALAWASLAPAALAHPAPSNNTNLDARDTGKALYTGFKIYYNKKWKEGTQNVVPFFYTTEEGTKHSDHADYEDLCNEKKLWDLSVASTGWISDSDIDREVEGHKYWTGQQNLTLLGKLKCVYSCNGTDAGSLYCDGVGDIPCKPEFDTYQDPASNQKCNWKGWFNIATSYNVRKRTASCRW